jgi:hypothetical protein
MEEKEEEEVCSTEHFNNINMLGYLSKVTVILIHL